MGAQINAFFFEHYEPFAEGLGTYVSQMHEEHGVGRRDQSSDDHDNDTEQPFAAVATDRQAHSNL